MKTKNDKAKKSEKFKRQVTSFSAPPAPPTPKLEQTVGPGRVFSDRLSPLRRCLERRCHWVPDQLGALSSYPLRALLVPCLTSSPHCNAVPACNTPSRPWSSPTRSTPSARMWCRRRPLSPGSACGQTRRAPIYLAQSQLRSRRLGHHRGDATSFGSVVTHDELHEAVPKASAAQGGRASTGMRVIPV